VSDFQSRITILVDQFVAQLTTAAREAAMQTLEAALGAANDVAARLGRGAPAAVSAPAIGRVTPKARAKGEKRAANEIESIGERLADFIQRNPGLRVEQINRELGTTTREVALPLRKLIADRVIRSEGEKRSTQYFPARPSRASTPSPPPAPVRRRRG